MKIIKPVSILLAAMLPLAAALTSCAPKEGDGNVLKGIELNEHDIALFKGDDTFLKCNPVPRKAELPYLEWRSSAPEIVEVDNAGYLTAGNTNGEATITVTTADKKYKDECHITVSTEATGIKISKGELFLDINQTETLTAEVQPADAYQGIRWESLDPMVATVEDGVVKGIAKGSTKILAISVLGGHQAECMVTVQKIIPVQSISLDKADIDIIKGNSFNLHATILPADATNQTIRWRRGYDGYIFLEHTNGADCKVIVLDKVSDGEHYVEAYTVDGGFSAKCIVNVMSKHVTYVDLDKTNLDLIEEDSEQLTATVYPTEMQNKKVYWSSSSPTVASVDANGVVRALKGGTTTITATSDDSGVTNECQVTVWPLVVDLGLPSGVKWAGKNVGATKLTDKGLYYAWGEVKSKSTFDWDTYKYCTGGDFHKLTKYNYYSYYGSVDNREVLLLDDDAANYQWGSPWRMPTYNEYEELHNNCRRVYDSTKKGYIYTSDKNGNKVFFPEAGYSNSSDGFYYWSSSLSSSTPTAARVYGDYSPLSRYYGLPIRPVR